MMKLRIVLLLFLAAYISSGKAQNRSIPFEETKLWTEIVEKARTAEKIIFVDCYTDWCGPCKMLSANVFTRDSVADFFQEHFVNTKFEMEKDADGIAYRQTWEVKAYPTLLFIDPRTEQVIHRVVGAVKPEALIQAAQKALDPTLNLRAMEERYEQGDRSPDFMVSYLGALQSAGLHPRKISIALEYLKSLSAERFATGYTWQILRNHIEDPLCGPMLRLWNERFHFYELPEVPREEVERKLESAILAHSVKMARWRPGKEPFDEQHYGLLMDYLREIDLPVRGPALAWLTTAELYRRGDWPGMLTRMKAVEIQQILDAGQFFSFFTFFIDGLEKCPHTETLQESLQWIDRKIAEILGQDAESLRAQGLLLLSKTRIYKALGSEEAGRQTEEQAIALFRTAQEL